jgi:hypothetical protein
MQYGHVQSRSKDKAFVLTLGNKYLSPVMIMSSNLPKDLCFWSVWGISFPEKFDHMLVAAVMSE